MLEFLRECDENNIYSDAMDVEIYLKSQNSLKKMCVFFENAFKWLMITELGKKPTHIEGKKIINLVNDNLLASFLNNTLKFTELNEVNNLIISCNSLNESRDSKYFISKIDREKCFFKAVFNYCAAFYCYKTGKNAPAWSEENYYDLYNHCVVAIEKEQKEELRRELYTLCKKVNQLKNEIDHCKKHIFLEEKKNNNNNDNLQNMKADLGHYKIELLKLEKEKNVLDSKIYVSEEDIKKQQKSDKKEKTQTPKNAFNLSNYYGISADFSGPSYCFFNTILTLKDIMNDQNNEILDTYAKFYFMTNLLSNKVNVEYRLVYSLLLRMLNRGTIIPASNNVKNKFIEKFNKTSSCNIVCLHDFYKYNSPYFPYDSDREKDFAETYFPKKLGEHWASVVMAQVGFDFIAPKMSEEEREILSGQRVDFYFNNAGKKYVIEIDGEEHKLSVEKDKFRDYILNKYNVKTIRITNDEVLTKSSEIDTKLSELKKTDFYLEVDFDEKLLVSLKIYNQIQIVILKMLEKGYIDVKSNIRINGLENVFSAEEMDYIFSEAIKDLKLLVFNLSKIYNIKIDLDFSDLNKEETNIYFGDGKLEGNSVIVRDCFPGHEFYCELEEFPQNIYPENILEDNIRFFLSYIFGYEDFREGQFEAIKRLLLRKDSIILLPTGAGKSIIYQLCSFLVPGMIIVVSPLVSLIKDQVDNLNMKFGITNAIPLFFSITEEDKANNKRKIRVMKNNVTSLLYLSPERLQIPSFRNALEELKLKNNIYAVAIDEAHCVSEWGHDFRAAYLNISKVARNILSKGNYVPTIIALTGTASDAVLSDVKRDLKIDDENSIVRPSSFDRKELKFSIYKCSYSSKGQLIARLIKNDIPNRLHIDYSEFTRRNVGHETKLGIVFTQIANSKDERKISALRLKSDLSNLLPELGINEYFSRPPDSYSKEMWNAKLQETAKLFKNDKLNLLVATKAFGMGIDKENIRYTIHAGIPASFEQYYQEAGRAGRDKKHSECVLVFSDDNYKMNEELLNPALSFNQMKEKYKNTKRKSKEDDLNSILYFHDNNFEGVEKELQPIIDVVENLKSSKEYYFLIDKSDKNVSKHLNAIVRLVILGIIKDYTYDYNGTFHISIDSIEKDHIIDKYADYISGYNVGRVESEKSKLYELNSVGWDFVVDAAKVLISYIYDFIEQSRRQAIRTIYNMAREASSISVEEQDHFIRERILSYFTIKDKNKEFLDSIIESKNVGYDVISGFINLKQESFNFDASLRKKANSLLMPIHRKLESKPDHPGLLYMLAICQMINHNPDSNNDICNNIIAAYNYSLSRYLINEEIVNKKLYEICNLVMNTSLRLFDTLIYSFDKNSINVIKIYKGILKNIKLKEEFKQYILLKYANEKLKELEV